MTNSARPLIDVYAGWLDITIDAKGVEIPHALSMAQDGTLTVMALAMSPGESYPFVVRHWVVEKPRELIFAFDRFTKPGQGTELGDLMAGFHLVGGEPPRPFIIEYRHAPRLVKPIDYGNAYWNAALSREMADTVVRVKAHG